MSDDQGWGQTGYYNHPVLKTPNLDEMAANGLRLDRFYSGAATCSPTRATILTGRSNNRTGVLNHGYGLNLQEKTLPKALKDAGYNTAHFGKWHLNYIGGPGVPMAKDDPHGPGKYGFDYWLTATNYFDLDPMLSRNGVFERFEGDSSEIIVDEALKYIRENKDSGRPFFTVIWYGSPHLPFEAKEKDLEPFKDLDEDSQAHYAELVAMDRSIGTLRDSLQGMGMAENTLVWFSSDNGGLDMVKPSSTGGLRGFKKSQYEGGIRVPCVVEWPKGITPKVSEFPAYTTDIFPTLVSLLSLDKNAINKVNDGIDLSPLFKGNLSTRKKPMFFSQMGSHAMIDHHYKLILKPNMKPEFYHLGNDSAEMDNLAQRESVRYKSMQQKLEQWLESVEQSSQGRDYPEGKITSKTREKLFWADSPYYKPHLDLFSKDKSLMKAVDLYKKRSAPKN
jgi:arylsulfatase A-like enzyme